MNLSELFKALANKGIKVTLDGDSLNVNAPKGTMTPAILNALKEHKTKLIDYLQRSVIQQDAITPAKRDEFIPLSHAQQSLWLLDAIEKGSAHYNDAFALTLSGDLNTQAMDAAFTSIFERHESLRTSFLPGEGNLPYQLIHDGYEYHVPVTDVSHLQGEELAQKVAQLTKDEAAQAFDLSGDLLLRTRLIKRGSSDFTLLITLHHIATDGWSIGILISEFCALYGAYVKAQPSPLPPLAVQYADYAYWQRQWTASADYDNKLAYWKKHLKDVPAIHSLQLDYPRGAQQTFNGANHFIDLSQASSQKLTTLCQGENASVFMGIYAAFCAFMARYTNETDIVVGTPTANRHHKELEGLIGVFINLLTLRADLSESTSFTQLLQQSRSVLLDAYANGQVPFEKVVEAVQPTRSVNYSPLFQILLVFNSEEESTFELPNLTLSTSEQNHDFAKYDITLDILESKRGLSFRWQYNCDLFSEQTISTMAEHFNALVSTLVATPDEDIFKVNMLLDGELQRLVVDSNTTKTAFAPVDAIHTLFEQQVAANPHGIALTVVADKGNTQDEQTLTYEQLNTRANTLAAYLQSAHQVGANSLVGICLARSVDMVVAVLAVLKAGGAYVPMDPQYPQSRLEYLVQDANPQAIISSNTDAERLTVTDMVICLDDADVQSQLAVISDCSLPQVSPSDLAYVIYTSGSTGQPKGVAVEHAHVINYLQHAKSAYYGQVDAAVVSSPLSFDATVTSLLGALVSGKCLHLLAADGASEIDALGDLIAQLSSPTLFKLTPSHLEGLAQKFANSRQSEQSHLLIVGGEQLRSTLAQNWVQNILPNSSMVNEYGPTETVVGCSNFVVNGDNAEQLHGLGVPIGLPTANMQLYVLNASLSPVGVGVPGELYIGGASVARGYLNRDTLTAERFIDNPFYDANDCNTSVRLYRTGDLVRWLAQGQLSYLGRIDEQVKIRGFRIETGEIEHCLSGFSAVQDCAVIATQLPSGDKGLVAYVVTEKLSEDRQSTIRDELKQHLSAILPDYMVPAVFMLLDELPLTANGKLNTRALPAPDLSAQQRQYVAPSTATEKALCEIWQEVLGLERVGVEDSFFELGGHSLLVMQVISGLQARNLVMEAHQLFATPKLADLASSIDSSDAEQIFVAPDNLIKEGSEVITPDMLPLVNLSAQEIDMICAQVPGGAANIQDIYPLGPLQQGILFHHMMSHGGGDPYVMPLLYKLANKAAFDKFVAGVEFVIERHDILRMAVVYESFTEAVQVIQRQVQLPIQWLEAPDNQDPQAYMVAQCAPELQNMALDKAPLVNLKVMDVVGSGEHLVLVQFHHMVSDHVGLDIIQDELSALEQGNTEHLVTPMPYREFIAHTLHQAEQHDAGAYFQKALGDVNKPSLPFGLSDIQGDGSQIIELKEAVPPLVCAQLRKVSRDMGISPAAIFHAVWGILIGGFSATQDVVFGTVVSGRLQGALGAVGTVGVFMNTLPLRVQMDNFSVSELIAQVQNALTELIPYEQASLAAAQRATSVPEDLPLFSGMLNYRHSAVGDLEQVEAVNSDMELIAGQERSNYPFCLIVDSLTEGFEISVQLDSAVDAQTVVNCTQAVIAKMADSLANEPSAPVSRVLVIPQGVYQSFLTDKRYYAQLLENAPVEQIPVLGAQQSSEQQSYELTITNMSHNDVELLAEGLNVAPLAVWLAVHFSVLSQLSGQKQTLSCIADGGDAFVLTSELSQSSWSELISDVATALSYRQQFGQYPLEAIAREQGVILNEVLFSMANCDSHNHHLVVNVNDSDPSDHSIKLSLTFDTSHYIHEQMETIADFYAKALSLCVGDISSPINVSLLDDKSLAAITALEQGPQHQQTPKFLLTQFLNQAQNHGDKVALRAGDITLSYSQLLTRVKRLGHYLESLDIDSDSRVGVYLPRGIAQVIAVLGVHYAGASYVALEPTHPEARLAYQVKDADVELLLLDKAQSGSDITAGLDVLLTDGVVDENWLAEYEQGHAEPALNAEQEAYVLYTSGSTGQPKGVSVNQGNLAHYLAHAQSYLSADMAGSVVSSPLCFDATITSLLTPLCTGQAVNLLPEGDEVMNALAEYLNDQTSNWLFKLTPSHLDALSESVEANANAQHVIVVGGEQYLVGSLRRWQGELLAGSTFVNEYGPTETVVGTSVFSSQDVSCVANLADGDAVPIGKPIVGSRLFVLGANGQRQGQNSAGLLYIGGAGVSVGYVNNPEQSAERFIRFEGERVYASGDSVRWNSQGDLVFIGRGDEQISLNGYRIEPGDIKGQLLTVAGVSQAHVLALNTEQGQRLVAYVVADKDSWAQTQMACQKHLAEQLADYMLPSVYIRLDNMPLTANGKLDMKALPTIDSVTSQGAVQYVAPANEQEQVIADIWADVLSAERVGRDDNFFALGGDSILSIRVIALLKRQDISISISDLFSHQTVAKLAAFYQQFGADDRDTIEVSAFDLLTEQERQGIDESVIEDAYPLSTLQSGMVFHTQMAEFSGVYHDINAEHLVCPWDQGLFTQALNDCIKAHPVLRTRYHLSGERPIQLVYKDVPTPLVVEDISLMPESSQDEYLANWQLQRQKYEFDWANGPLFQVNIFNRSADSFAFALSFHHSLLDGWSRASLTTELYNRYQQLLQGKPLAVLPTEYIYRQYVALELEALNNDASAKHFSDMLDEAPGQQLPVNGASDDKSSDTHGYHEVSEFRARSKALIALAASLGVPVQIVIQALHVKVIHSISGQPKVLSNVVQSGRPETEGGEQGIGLFLNSLPMVVTPTSGSWKDLIDQLMAVNNQTLAHRHYPLSQITQDSGLSFDEVLFNYTHFHVFSQAENNQQEDTVTLLASGGFEQTNYGLTVDLQRGGVDDGIGLHLRYDSSLYAEDFMARFGQYFVRAADNLLTNVNNDYYQLSLLSDSEHDGLLQLDTKVQSYTTGNLHALFEARAEQTPNAIALEFEQQQLTYAELNEQATALAGCLLSQTNIEPDTLVGICLDRSAQMVVSILAVLKAGAAYVPLDPDYPQSRLQFMLGDAKPAAILTTEVITENVLVDIDTDARIICLDSDKIQSELKANNTVQLPQVSPSSLAYIIYTSGSTGQPKGVMVEHGHVHRLLTSTETDFGFNANDVFCLFHSFSFDFSVWEIWGALAYGGRLVVVPRWQTRSPEDFYRMVASRGVTVLNQTPTAFIQFMAQDELQGKALALRFVVFGGEALNLPSLNGWVNRRGDEATALVNMYGITETTVHVTFRRIMAADIAAGQGSVIGRPLSDLRVYLLNEYLQPVPTGCTGEMYVGGGGVTRGYLNRSALTAERFIDNPYVAGQRLYRTGDLGRYLGNGELVYQGRCDEQVKIRGFRIELGEIEAQLSSVNEVDSAVVLMYQAKPAANDDKDASKQLVAWMRLTTDAANDQPIAQIRKQLEGRLPVHMLPSHYVVVEDWPLTVNGKVDKGRLPEPDVSQGQVNYVAPQNQTQQALCVIWQDILKVSRVGIEDNFFNLGGDSIVSISIVARMREDGFGITVRDIFEYPTIKTLSERVVDNHGVSDVQALEPFTLLTEQEHQTYQDSPLYQQIEDAYPLSQLQSGMVFHTQKAEFDGVYHDIMSDQLRCPWDEQAFERALTMVVEAHPLLRTGFNLTGERPLQHVFANVELPLIVEDLLDMNEQEQQDYVDTWREVRRKYEFDWENGPLYQVNIFITSDETFEMVISFHHAILDGWSLATLNTQLFGLYLAEVKRQTPTPLPVEWVYREFIALEQQSLGDQEATDLFVDMLEDSPTQQLPLKVGASRTEIREQGTHLVPELVEFSKQLTDISRTLSVPLQSVLLAVHFKVLSQVSGFNQVYSCVTHNGRPEVPGAQSGLGLFLNSLPVGLNIQTGSWADLIQSVAQVSRQVLPHRRYPLQVIQKDTDRELGEVTFNYTHFHVYNSIELETDDDIERIGGSGFEQTNFDFHVDVSRSVDSEDSLVMAVHYNRHLFEDEQVATIASYYVKAFTQCVADIYASHEVSLLDEQTQTEIKRLEQGKAHQQPPALFLEQFLVHAQAKPQNVALSGEGIELNYQQLLTRVRRLGHYLESLDIDSDSRVGIYLPRSIAQVVAVLGVHYAGASYVALEPTHPQARLAYQVSDSDVEMLLLNKAQSASDITSGLDVLLMDGVFEDDWLAQFDQGDASPDELTGEQEAYVLYTSGSTGQPKGVSVNQDNLGHYLAHAKSYLTADMAGAVVSSPLCFDATISSLLTPLCTGKAVHLLPEGDEVMEALPHYLNDTADNWLFKLTPSHLDALSESVDKNAAGQHVLVIGGEQWLCGSLRRWQGELLPNCTFINEYGPTETVVGTSVFTSNGVDSVSGINDGEGVPIGTPIMGSNLYVIGASGLRQPIGSAGELYIGGAGVSQGYLNKAQQTGERFIDFEGERIYRSGDLVRRNSQGDLVFMGRGDEQISLNGYRIEPGDIKGHLLAVKGVSQAEIMAVTTAQGQRLVAYVVCGEENWSNVQSACRSAVVQALADYMQPAFYVRLEAMPLTANGKLDTKALPDAQSFVGEGQKQTSYSAPKTPLEQLMVDIWADVLSMKRVGLDDNFFTLGGDSILSIRVVALLKRQGVIITIGDLFTHQTISKLIAFYEQSIGDKKVEINTDFIAKPMDEFNEQWSERDIADEAGVEQVQTDAFELVTEQEREEIEALSEQQGKQILDAYPLSTLQAGMVFHTQLEQFSGVYHDIVNEHIVCPWDERLFHQALTETIDAHPILRTRFRMSGDRPLQLVYRFVDAPLVVEDVRHLDEDGQIEYMEKWIQKRRQHVFDWAVGSLFQVNIFNRSDDSFSFAFSFHHSLMDGWSRASLTTNLYNRYQQLLRGESPAPLPTEHIYRQYIALEQQSMNSEDARNYYMQMLADAPGTQLPVKQAAGQQRYDSYGEYSVSEFSKRSRQLIMLASKLGVPLQAVLQSIQVKVLQALSGQQTALTNVVSNGRPETEGGETGIGLFLNSPPMVIRPVDGSWRDLIYQVLKVSNNSVKYRHYPLAQISQQSGLTFDEVIFNYTYFHVFEQIEEDAQGDELALLDSAGFEQTNYGLTVDIQRNSSDNLNLHLSYDRNRFDDQTMVLTGEYFIRAADLMLANVDADCFNLDLLSNQERQRILVTYNDSHKDYPLHQTIHGLFAEQVANDADAIAIEFDGRKVTYAELDNQSSALAQYLTEQTNVTHESLVGICQERSVEMVVSILAVLKAGGAYVPMDPDYPQSRIDYMVEDSAPVTVLTTSTFASLFDASNTQVICVDSEQIKSLTYTSSASLATVNPNNLAYVIYTSGSTGKPKGVMVEHAQVVNYLHHAIEQYYVDVKGAVVSSPLAFDATVTSLLAGLCAGKCLHLLAGDATAQLERLGQLLGDNDQSLLFKITPSHLEGLAQRLGADKGEAISSQAHRLIVGGEQLTRETAKAWVEVLLPNGVMVNEYGPTETVVGCATYEFNQQTLGDFDSLAMPIGLPTANMQLYVLGNNLLSVGENVPGELYIGGVSVTRGYLNRQALTDERFVDNPFYKPGQPDYAKRLYRTGDQVKWLPQGQMVYLGRLDEQVKIRGFRIETGEIEFACRTYQEVTDCAVIADTLPSGDVGLVAYIVAQQMPQAQQNDFRLGLKQHLASQLPDYMVPTVIMLIESLPLTVNGKLDTKALPKPDIAGQQQVYVAPSTETEQIICTIWQDLLGVEQVGIHDNFFELGGHSLLIMQVIARLQASGRVMEVQQLFTAPVVVDLAAVIDNQEAKEAFTAPENLLDTSNADMMADITIDDDDDKGSDEIELTI